VGPDKAVAASDVEPSQVIQSLENTYGVHPAQRRNHTKGTCATGIFVGTPAAAALSRSRQFSDAQVPVVARFSVAGGDPLIADATPNARGMALEFRLSDGSRQHMTMLNTPMFGAAIPATFNAMILAMRPDPNSGKTEPNKVREFFASHPDARAQADFLKTHNPPVSYANSAYYGIHTFKFIDASGGVHAVKWQFTPRNGEKRLTTNERAAAPRDFLEQRLLERVHQGPVRWDMVVYWGARRSGR
jgi:catalase